MTRRLLALVAVVGVTLALGLTTPARAYSDERQMIIDTAYSKLGSTFQLGASGPDKFDCSGFAWWVYSTAGLSDRIGGTGLTANGFYRYFDNLGETFTDWSQAHPGDLVFYKEPGQRVHHMGIVTSFNKKGKPKVTSALINPWGVSEMRYNALDVPFFAFAHVDLDSTSGDPGPTPPPTPDPNATPTPTPSATPSPGQSPDAIGDFLASDQATQLLQQAMGDGTYTAADARALLDEMAAGR